MAKSIISAGVDNVLIFANSASANYILAQPNPVPEEVIFAANMGDIWIRDFSSVDGVTMP